MTPYPLGRRVPTDFSHVDKYPLSALPADVRPTGVPVPIGINWYTSFDSPAKGSNGRWRVTLPATATVRGGHCVCLKPAGLTDPAAWWDFYDQGREGSCVGFGCSRCMSLLNRVRYDARWLYHQAQPIDEYPDTPPAEGTSVRAGMDVLRTVGAVRVRGGVDALPAAGEGIAANRWATGIQDVLTTLGMPDATEVPMTNNWGRGYPHVVYVPAAALERLMGEDGEFAVVTDR